MSSLGAIIRGNLRNNAVHFALASVGVIVGIAAFAFFLALGAGVRNVVLGKIFPLDQLEVIAKTMTLDVGPMSLGLASDVLDDAAAEQLRKVAGVRGVYPKMKLTAPAIGLGGAKIIGNDIRTELIIDGIDPKLVEGELPHGPSGPESPGSEHFRDLVDPADPNEEKAAVCADDAACPKDMYCGRPLRGGANKVCRNYVPVLASPHMLEIYNGSLRRAYNLPRLNPDFLLGVTMDMRVGASMVEAAEKSELLLEKLKLVGWSDKAVPLGVTLPLAYVSRYNVHFGTAEAASRYHSMIVKITAKDQVAAVAKAIEDLGFEVTDGGAEQAGFLISVFVLVFSLLSTIIVGIAAVNIMHVFFMLVYERQREIGIMRAVGARRWDIQRIILGEAASVGLLAGSLGVALAYGTSRVFDWVSARYLPDFPYKPETYFAFSADLIALALAFAAGFCVIGAWLPARRAARMDPAAVLTGR